ncbi:hypothetical protein [Mesorhizobium sp. ES1-4]|uniref:hypothetical protein n=1 Tax=Mesorhizobium sp. ES1-4 TaxID=2876627 RepID=UPI001CCF8097|nr:hypothetical protein [Mesorhizobium sp. ES1-4]MBZ9795164.1 hypothetical protein [Mesorhizobium sp. ES1-4]
MVFETFTGVSWVIWDARIDTRLLRVNVFYREKTVLRQLFFRCRSGLGKMMALETVNRA